MWILKYFAKNKLSVDMPTIKALFTEFKNLLKDHKKSCGMVFKCTSEGCSKGFSSPLALRRHSNIHSGQFTCDICNRGFGSLVSPQIEAR